MAKLLFGIHNHQPVDNFRSIVDEAVAKAYRPFIERAAGVENFRFALHFSGWLFQEIKERYKELFTLIRKLVERGQVELFTGGFYEPILSSIPSDWRKYQIEKLNTFLKENFGVEPQGLWLTERVWEDSIIKDLRECGIEYVVVDDYHFIATGFERETLNGFFITESEGECIKVYPIDKTLRYLIPFKPVEKSVDYLKDSYGTRVLFDDGEKFGVWPDTYQWVYEEGWIESFLEAIKEGRIETKLFKENAEREKAQGIAYLPNVAYYEMGEWSLPPERFKEVQEAKNLIEKNFGKEAVEKLLRGGIWKNFFVKYPESNYMHKRMLFLASLKGMDSEELKDCIAKAQCNDVFWHGIFGGIYLPNLRDNFWRYTIRATDLADKLGKIEFPLIKDLDHDGYPEVLLSSDELIVGLSPRWGGSLSEFSLKDRCFNYQATLSRRIEGYHLAEHKDKKIGEEGILTIHEIEEIPHSVEIIKDWHLKNSFVSHFTFQVNDTGFRKENFKEIGDFADQPFELLTKGKNVTLKRIGGFYLEKKYRTELKKSFSLQENRLTFVQSVESEYRGELIHLLELNFHFIAPDKFYLREIKPDRFVIEDSGLNKELVITASKPFKLLNCPIETVHQREGGFEKTVQGYSFGLIFPFKGSLLLKVSLEVKNV